MKMELHILSVCARVQAHCVLSLQIPLVQAVANWHADIVLSVADRFCFDVR